MLKVQLASSLTNMGEVRHTSQGSGNRRLKQDDEVNDNICTLIHFYLHCMHGINLTVRYPFTIKVMS